MRALISFVTRFVPRRRSSGWPSGAADHLPVFGEPLRGPINGRTYRKFLSYGRGDRRPNALALDTLSLERHRAVWMYLTDTATCSLAVREGRCSTWLRSTAS